MPPNSKVIKTNTKRACERCIGKRHPCDSQSSCQQCTESSEEEYIQERTRNIFTVQELKRLSSACDTCRKKKTKCGGGKPCPGCVANRLECVYPEKDDYNKPGQTMDRIEDRLKRIEKLMAAFSPSYFNQAEGHRVRPHRHSVQGINSAREKKDLLDRKVPRGAKGYCSFSSIPARSQPSIDHSMLNLSLSPTLVSASTSSASESQQSDGFGSHLPTPSLSSHSDNEFNLPIPSVTDQLSEHTFVASSIDYPITQYPIYPLNTLSGHRNSA